MMASADCTILHYSLWRDANADPQLAVRCALCDARHMRNANFKKRTIFASCLAGEEMAASERAGLQVDLHDRKMHPIAGCELDGGKKKKKSKKKTL